MKTQQPTSISKKVILNDQTVKIVEEAAKVIVADMAVNKDRAFSMALRGIILEWNKLTQERKAI